MLSIMRRFFRDTNYYNFAANIYHSVKRLAMRSTLVLSKTKYLSPRRPEHNYQSQFGQDYYLEKLGLIKRGGVFLEVGCNHPITNSNSYYLEKTLNWSGISIDGVDFSDEYARERPKTEFVHCVIDLSEGETEFYQVHDVTGWETQISSLYLENLDLGVGFTADKKIVRTLPLSFFQKKLEVIDLCLIDVEGHELHVLNSINWKTFPPKVFVIENVGEFYPRYKLKNFMRDKGYRLLARIGTTDDIYVQKK